MQSSHIVPVQTCSYYREDQWFREVIQYLSVHFLNDVDKSCFFIRLSRIRPQGNFPAKITVCVILSSALLDILSHYY